MEIIICTNPVLDSPPGQKFLIVIHSELGSVVNTEILCNPEGGEQLPQDLYQALGSGFLLTVKD